MGTNTYVEHVAISLVSDSEDRTTHHWLFIHAYVYLYVMDQYIIIFTAESSEH